MWEKTCGLLNLKIRVKQLERMKQKVSNKVKLGHNMTSVHQVVNPENHRSNTLKYAIHRNKSINAHAPDSYVQKFACMR